VRKEAIEVGRVYLAKINKVPVPVRVVSRRGGGERGWAGLNLATGRMVAFGNAGRFRRLATEDEVIAALKWCVQTYGGLGRSSMIPEYRQMAQVWQAAAARAISDSTRT
jgi:hypothetical protein